jgi:hypothetical protein
MKCGIYRITLYFLLKVEVRCLMSMSVLVENVNNVTMQTNELIMI